MRARVADRRDTQPERRRVRPTTRAWDPAVYNKGFRYDYGAAFGLVPDRVARVKWVFTGAGIGITHPHPTTIYPTVRNNVAAAVFDPVTGRSRPPPGTTRRAALSPDPTVG